MNAHPDTAAVETTREAILAAAEQVIREHGVGATTTRLIAATAGCSEGSIYNHFAGKDALVSHVVCERLASFPERALALPTLAGAGDVETNLRELVALAIDFFTEMAPMTAAAIGDPEPMRRRAAEMDAQGKGPRSIIRALEAYLRREQQLGRVGAHAHPQGAAIALVGGAWHHAHVTGVWDVEIVDADRAPATEIVAAVMAGLRA